MASIPASRSRGKSGDPVLETLPQEMSKKFHTQSLSTFLCLKSSCRGSWEQPAWARLPHPRGNSVIREEGEQRFLWTSSILERDTLGTFPICTATELLKLMTKSVLFAGIRLSMKHQPLLIQGWISALPAQVSPRSGQEPHAEGALSLPTCLAEEETSAPTSPLWPK